MTHRPIAEIKAELDAALKAEQEELEARRKLVEPIYEYVIYPIDNYDSKKIIDPSCVLYELTSVVMNTKELKDVGYSYSAGSMCYLFNKLSGQIVTTVGGGSIYLGLKNSDGMYALSEFLVNNPKGGNITRLVNEYKQSNGQWWD